MYNKTAGEIRIYFGRIDRPFTKRSWLQYFRLLPADQQERNVRFRRWEDRHAHMIGRLLLLHAWQQIEPRANPLPLLAYDTHQRPFLPCHPEIDFNISHSGRYSMFAIGAGLRLGIDIEQEPDSELSCFRDTMNSNQWNTIHRSANPSATFCRFWTTKECVAKADGRGLTLPIAQIEWQGDIASLDRRQWYLRRLDFLAGHHACLASDTPQRKVTVREVLL
jgi:4'-phosphopantetheinyl transferase